MIDGFPVTSAQAGVLQTGMNSLRPRTTAEQKLAGRLVHAFHNKLLYMRLILSGTWNARGELAASVQPEFKRLEEYDLKPCAGALGYTAHRRAEPEYLAGPARPRAAMTLQKGIHTRCLSAQSWFFDVQIALLDPDPLAFYKQDAESPYSVGVYPAESELMFLTSKQLDSEQAHRWKREEMESRRQSLYFPRSSGHFDSSGRHTGGKKGRDYFVQAVLPYDEITLDGYRREDYAAIVIDSTNWLLPWQSAHWQRLLEEQQYYDQPLGLVVYDISRASAAVFFPHELNGLDDGRFSEAVFQLNRLCQHCNLSPWVTGNCLMLAGPQIAFATLSAMVEELEDMADAMQDKDWQFYRQLVLGDSSLSELKQALRNGVNPNRRFTGQDDGSLVEALFGLTRGYSEQTFSGIPVYLAGVKAIRGRYRRHYSNWMLGREMIRCGLECSAYEITDERVYQNPMLAAELYLAGARLSCSPSCLLAYLALSAVAGNSPGVKDLIDRVLIRYQREGHREVSVQALEHVRTVDRALEAKASFNVGAALALAADQLFLPTEQEKQQESRKHELADRQLERACKFLLNLGSRKLPDTGQLDIPEQAVPETQLRQVPFHASDPVEYMAGKITEAYRRCSLTVTNLDDFPGNCQHILQHYYLRPSDQQVKDYLQKAQFPALHRNIHNADHVVRTVMNTEWLVELFQKYQLDQEWLSPKACLFLQYAALYHDRSAELSDSEFGGKCGEELQAALAMEKDLGPLVAEEDYPLFLEVVSALRNKNIASHQRTDPPYTPDVDGTRERLFRRILRMADSIEITRDREVGDDFAEPSTDDKRFYLSFSDVPEAFASSPAFRSELTECVHNNMDLAFMTGGRCDADKRSRQSHGRRYHLRDTASANKKRQEVICLDPDVYQRIQHEQRLLIARRLAAEFGLHYLYDDELGSVVDLQPIHTNQQLEEFAERIRPVLDRLTPLQRQAYTCPEQFEMLKAEVAPLVRGWLPTIPLGTLDQLDLASSSSLRAILKLRGKKVISESVMLYDVPTTVYRVVDHDDPGPEADCMPEHEAEKARRDRRARIEQLRDQAGNW